MEKTSSRVNTTFVVDKQRAWDRINHQASGIRFCCPGNQSIHVSAAWTPRLPCACVPRRADLRGAGAHCTANKAGFMTASAMPRLERPGIPCCMLQCAWWLKLVTHLISSLAGPSRCTRDPGRAAQGHARDAESCVPTLALALTLTFTCTCTCAHALDSRAGAHLSRPSHRQRFLLSAVHVNQHAKPGIVEHEPAWSAKSNFRITRVRGLLASYDGFGETKRKGRSSSRGLLLE